MSPVNALDKLSAQTRFPIQRTVYIRQLRALTGQENSNNNKKKEVEITRFSIFLEIVLQLNCSAQLVAENTYRKCSFPIRPAVIGLAFHLNQCHSTLSVDSSCYETTSRRTSRCARPCSSENTPQNAHDIQHFSQGNPA